MASATKNGGSWLKLHEFSPQQLFLPTVPIDIDEIRRRKNCGAESVAGFHDCLQNSSAEFKPTGSDSPGQ